jgi:hypothetical protein
LIRIKPIAGLVFAGSENVRALGRPSGLRTEVSTAGQARLDDHQANRQIAGRSGG